MTPPSEGMDIYCVDCNAEIGTGVRCSECTIDCRECGETFKTEGSRNNHEHSGHCAACGQYLGTQPEAEPQAVVHRTPDIHTQDHFVIEGLFIHPVTMNKMGGGYLCSQCTTDDLNKV